MSYAIQKVEKKDYLELIEVWEASVRATHHFISEEDIQVFKPLILNKYLDMVDLCCVRGEDGRMLGFLGTSEDRIEMLFLHPDSIGKGIGKVLMDYATGELGCRKVEVNEQNEHGVGFYKHLGFRVVGRMEQDGLGKPYPILFMELE